MKSKTLEFLRKHRILTGIPTIVKFKTTDGNFANFKAKRLYYVVRWDYILKAFRMEELKNETK